MKPRPGVEIAGRHAIGRHRRALFDGVEIGRDRLRLRARIRPLLRSFPHCHFRGVTGVTGVIAGVSGVTRSSQLRLLRPLRRFRRWLPLASCGEGARQDQPSWPPPSKIAAPMTKTRLDAPSIVRTCWKPSDARRKIPGFARGSARRIWDQARRKSPLAMSPTE